MNGPKPTAGSVRSRLKNEAEKAIEGWDETRAPMPTRIVVMALLDLILSRPKATVHVLDYTHPNEYFTVERRVASHIMREYGLDGELFATINEDERLKSGRFPAFLPGFMIGEKAYTFMRKAPWDKLAHQYERKPKNLEEALRHSIDAVRDQTS